MNFLLRKTLWLWAAMWNSLHSAPSLWGVRAMSAVAVALSCLAVPAAHAAEPSKLEVPETQNSYIRAVATLYNQGRYEEALSMLEKALDWKSNGKQEVIWLKLVQGVLRAELSQGDALEPFKQALALDKEARLPMQSNRRIRKLFEQARTTLGLPADKEQLAKELEASARTKKAAPPPRRHGLSVGVRGEVDVLGLELLSSLAPAVSLGYTREKLGGVMTVLVQPSPGLRAEGQFHPLTLGWVRPYARLGATAFFNEKNAQGTNTFFSGVSARAVLGADVQFTSRMYAFADVAYEHFLISGVRYRTDSLLFSVGVGLFP